MLSLQSPFEVGSPNYHRFIGVYQDLAYGKTTLRRQQMLEFELSRLAKQRKKTDPEIAGQLFAAMSAFQYGRLLYEHPPGWLVHHQLLYFKFPPPEKREGRSEQQRLETLRMHIEEDYRKHPAMIHDILDGIEVEMLTLLEQPKFPEMAEALQLILLAIDQFRARLQSDSEL